MTDVQEGVSLSFNRVILHHADEVYILFLFTVVRNGGLHVNNTNAYHKKRIQTV